MKKLLKVGAFLLAMLVGTSAFAACSGNDDSGGGFINSSGEYEQRPGAKETTITFWGYGDTNELKVFNTLVDNFNKLHKGQIKVDYKPQVAGDYGVSTNMALSADKARVDILYVGDADFKAYAEAGYLEPLDNYLATSSEVVIDEMWATSVNRFKYDVNTTTQDGPDAHYWGIPKDIGPTVIFYNETYFNIAGVQVFSVAAGDLEAFNNGAKDSRGKTKAEYGIAGEVKEKGYFVDASGNKWFNNQVPMSWDECVTLSTLVQNAVRANKNRNNIYGYFTEWWFNYGWSVGGDCIEYVKTDDPAYNGGYWDFTLMDATPNYIVADDQAEGYTIDGVHYEAGEIISWESKLVDTAASQKTIKPAVIQAEKDGILNQLPSQRDAFVEFVRVGQKTNIDVEAGLKGYGICPDPLSLGGDAGKATAFSEGNLAMLVDGRWNVTNFRLTMDNKFAWDVAPLPMYKEYDAEGNITVHGVEAGHSGSVALCINAKSTKKAEAWMFAEYIGGATGQSAQAESGFAIPSQKAIANSEVFLQTNQNPRNSIVFVRAAEHQTPGDWWYLRDNAWIDDWALYLNGKVRNGEATLSQFEQSNDYLKTWGLLLEYTRKK